MWPKLTKRADAESLAIGSVARLVLLPGKPEQSTSPRYVSVAALCSLALLGNIDITARVRASSRPFGQRDAQAALAHAPNVERQFIEPHRKYAPLDFVTTNAMTFGKAGTRQRIPVSFAG